jgi:hypothetical protein
MLISNLVKELKTWSLRNSESVKPVKIKIKNAEIYANLKSGEKVAKNVLKHVITQIIL